MLWSKTAPASYPWACNLPSSLTISVIARSVRGSRVFLRISTKPAQGSTGIHSAGARAPLGFKELGWGGLGWVGVGWVGSIESALPLACESDAVRTPIACCPALVPLMPFCVPRSQRMLAAILAASTRRPRFAAHGLCSGQSCTTHASPVPSKNPTSISVLTKTPDSPFHPAAISMSSADNPCKFPSDLFSATHRNRHTSAHVPGSCRRRSNFTVFGWRGSAVEIRASSAITSLFPQLSILRRIG